MALNHSGGDGDGGDVWLPRERRQVWPRQESFLPFPYRSESL